jgi:RHS repeat-associated protein
MCSGMTTIGTSNPTYDANGNVTNDCLNTYAWDANGRPVTINGVGATYDALGRMVELNRSGTYSEIAYDPMGNRLALMNGQSLVKAFVPLTGGAVAVYTSSGLDHYRHSDWLGSARLMTSPGQTEVGDVAYSPYGETYAQSGIADFSFTGMNTDADPTNPAVVYDFPAREYGIQGRWPSPDPAGLGAVDPTNPQSWNRYAYVGNNPLALTDPMGLWYGEQHCDDSFSCDPCWWNPDYCWDNPCYFTDCYGGGGGGGGAAPPPPQAPPAPPGGYGAGIDPYGTWNEQVPAGVQVFPSSFPGGLGSGCPYGSGYCGGGVYGFQGIPTLPPQVWDEAGDFAIRVIVWGTAIYESARIATSQSAHNAYNAAKSYLSQQLDKLHPSPPQNNSGRQKKCHIQSVGPGYCTYVCEDGTTTVDPSCVPIIYVPHVQAW